MMARGCKASTRRLMASSSLGSSIGRRSIGTATFIESYRTNYTRDWDLGQHKERLREMKSIATASSEQSIPIAIRHLPATVGTLRFASLRFASLCPPYGVLEWVRSRVGSSG